VHEYIHTFAPRIPRRKNNYEQGGKGQERDAKDTYPKRKHIDIPELVV
jgi:hypothetical protein